MLRFNFRSPHCRRLHSTTAIVFFCSFYESNESSYESVSGFSPKVRIRVRVRVRVWFKVD